MAPAECLAEGVVALDQSCHTNSLAHSNMVTVCVCVCKGKTRTNSLGHFRG